MSKGKVWVGHGSGRDREQTWASGWGSRVVPKSRWRGNGYADSTAEYLRAFTASGKIFRTGNYRSTFWPRRVAALCVARSIDTGYVLLQIRSGYTRVCWRENWCERIWINREREEGNLPGCEIVRGKNSTRYEFEDATIDFQWPVFSMYVFERYRFVLPLSRFFY